MTGSDADSPVPAGVYKRQTLFSVSAEHMYKVPGVVRLQKTRWTEMLERTKRWTQLKSFIFQLMAFSKCSAPSLGISNHTSQTHICLCNTLKSQRPPRLAWALLRLLKAAGDNKRRPFLKEDPPVLGDNTGQPIDFPRGPWICWRWDWPSPGTVADWWCSEDQTLVKPTSSIGSWIRNLRRGINRRLRTFTESCSTSEESHTSWTFWTPPVRGTSRPSGGCPFWQVRQWWV